MNSLQVFAVALVGVIVATVTGLMVQPNIVVQPSEVKSYGALSSPDIASNYISWGGVRSWAYQPGMASASKTVCSVATPAATSTLVHASLEVDAQPYTNIYEIGIGASATATTTRVALGTVNTATNYLVATTTNITSTIVTPNNFVNVNVSTTTVASNFAPTGHCNVMFREL